MGVYGFLQEWIQLLACFAIAYHQEGKRGCGDADGGEV